MRIKKTLALLLLTALTVNTAFAGEGMWLLNKLNQVNEAQMRELGFKLTADDIYSLNHASMKDGVARLGGGFCSGEIVSATGLLLTNHHCGYDAIQSISSVEHDYMTDGFWATSPDQERPAGFEVSFLESITDVSDTVLSALQPGMSEDARDSVIQVMGYALRKKAIGGRPHILADLKSMYEGNEFYVFVYKSYPDVRLVGAPPNAIGNFGGDTDNWEWPRHTGDFSMFRVYTGRDGEPAEYAKDNIPYAPKWYFHISMDGVKKGDFSMVMGYPGSTDRFLNSDGVKLAIDAEQPAQVKVRGKKLDMMKEHMEADPVVQIKYAAKYNEISNYWKYYIGQQKELKDEHIAEKKQAQETQLMAWVDSDPALKTKYAELATDLSNGYAERAKTEKANVYLEEGAFGSECVTLGFDLYGLQSQLDRDPKDSSRMKAYVARARTSTADHWKDYDAATDRDLTAAVFRMIHEDVDPAQQPDIMNVVAKKYKGDFDKWAAAMFKTSILTDSTRLAEFLAHPTAKVIDKDMGMQTMQSCLDLYYNVLGPARQEAQGEIDRGYRLMVAAMREMEPNKLWYPNANSTMRLTYGEIGGYSPKDAVHYDLATTQKGILQKENDADPEFIVPKREHDMLVNRDFGRYANTDGNLPICFLSDNDITGGNSGSPVINANGELIGLAFDGNWESMSGDISFDPALNRTICVDIRYVLWVIDKYAGAKNFVDEMTLESHAKDAKPQKEMAPVQGPTKNPAAVPAGG